MAGGGGGGEDGKEGNSASEAASIVFRIVTVGLSLASAITTAASTQCVYGVDGHVAGTASYSDYHSFRYAMAADLVSAVLQGVAIYLEAVRKEEAARVVELIDKLVQALTSSSAALLLAVADITSCGLPSSRRGGRRQQGNLCSQPGRFCGQVRVSSVLSVAAVASFSVSVYTRHDSLRRAAAVPSPPTKRPTTRRPTVLTLRRTPSPPRLPSLPLPPPSPPPPTPPSPSPSPRPPTPPRPYVGCPRLTIPCSCENPELCAAAVPSPPTKRPTTHCPTVLTLGRTPSPPRLPSLPPTPPSPSPSPRPPTPPRPYVGCPRLTIPCSCENPELCAAFF